MGSDLPAKLARILAGNRDTDYGLAHGFSGIGDLAAFQARVPLTTYDDYEPWIAAIRAGGAGVLTAEPVLLLHPSSGSTAPSKLIPYTAGLRAEFAGALRTWLTDLVRHFPGLRGGAAYFTITPPTLPPDLGPSRVPIGFADDTFYLDPWLGEQVAARLVTPAGLDESMEMDDFWDATVAALLGARNVRFVSVWNPTFLLILLEHAGVAPARLFPDLEVISCWADGNSRSAAERVRRLFPGVHVQPKGLLATEGVVTIPVEGLGKRLTSAHFFEFETDDGDIRLPDQLVAGRQYGVVMTTSGGLYRYRLGDVVEYRGRACFEFVGKAAGVSDRFGDKLNEVHVRRVVGGAAGFRLLVPEDDRYVLYTDDPLDPEAIDAGLRENFHYDLCRALGQLKPVRVVVVDDGDEQYVDNCLGFGMRLGDIKPMTLSARSGWVFRPRS